MRGDYVEVLVNANGTFTTTKMQAKTVGGTVEVDVPRTGDFAEVRELDKAGRPVRTARFAKPYIVHVIEGHETLGNGKVRVSSRAK